MRQQEKRSRRTQLWRTAALAAIVLGYFALVGFWNQMWGWIDSHHEPAPPVVHSESVVTWPELATCIYNAGGFVNDLDIALRSKSQHLTAMAAACAARWESTRPDDEPSSGRGCFDLAQARYVDTYRYIVPWNTQARAHQLYATLRCMPVSDARPMGAK